MLPEGVLLMVGALLSCSGILRPCSISSIAPEISLNEKSALTRYATTPSALARSLSESSLKLESTTTGVFSSPGSLRRPSRNSKPFMVGKTRSSMMRSGFDDWACLRPSSALIVGNTSTPLSRNCFILSASRLCRSGSSSMMSIFFPFKSPVPVSVIQKYYHTPRRTNEGVGIERNCSFASFPRLFIVFERDARYFVFIGILIQDLAEHVVAYARQVFILFVLVI